MTEEEIKKIKQKRKALRDKILKEGFVTDDSEFNDCIDPELIKESQKK